MNEYPYEFMSKVLDGGGEVLDHVVGKILILGPRLAKYWNTYF